MLICHCQVINDAKIRSAISAGARTVGQVGKASGAGTCCGGCVPAIVELIDGSSNVRALPVVGQALANLRAEAAE